MSLELINEANYLIQKTINLTPDFGTVTFNVTPSHAVVKIYQNSIFLHELTGSVKFDSLLSGNYTCTIEAPYFNTLIAAVQKLTNSNTKVDESVKLETLMNRMCFNLLFRSDELPEDEELLYKVLIKRTPFNDVLERVAKEKDTYNSVPDEADGSK